MLGRDINIQAYVSSSIYGFNIELSFYTAMNKAIFKHLDKSRAAR